MEIKLQYFFLWFIIFTGRPTLYNNFRKTQYMRSTFFFFVFFRTFIYPFRTINPKPVPILNCIMAFIFCFYNGLLQGMYLTNVYTIETSTSTILGNFLFPTAKIVDTNLNKICLIWTGALMFLGGMAINIHYDGILIGLRKTSGKKATEKSEYKIPRGGLFELISGANYFGEIVEWWGLFTITNGMPQVIRFILLRNTRS